MNNASVPNIAVIGLGNILMQDDGIGVRVVERLQARAALASTITLVDGGTLGLELLGYLEDAAQVLFVDAVRMGQPPGTLVRLEGDEIPATFQMKLSLHQAGVLDLLAASQLQGYALDRVVVWGIEPAATTWGTELTPAIAAQVESLVEAVEGEVQAWLASSR